jgi:outer membrane protein assembly factor BamA
LSRSGRFASVVACTIALHAAVASAQPEPDPDAVDDDGAAAADDDDGDDAAALGAQPATIDIPAPPVLWSSWAVEAAPGYRLLESAETLHEVLEPEMRGRQALTQSSRDGIVAACAAIGYHLDNMREERTDAGVRIVLVLIPYQVVRHVEIDASFWRLWIQSELQRRMRLRVGEALEIDPEARATQLNDEARRLEEFLHDEGFFEARVTIKVTPTGVYGADVAVLADLGPAYKVGHIRIDHERGATAIGHGEIRDTFTHCYVRLGGWCPSRRRFSRSRHQGDIEGLTAKYRRRGYPAARIRSDYDPATSFDRQSKTVDFTLRIDERRQIAVEFQGNSAFSHDALARLLTFDAAASADDLEAAASALAVQRFYQQRGWFDAAVSWERDRKRIEGAGGAGDRAFDLIRFRIDEGSRRTLRTIELVGEQAIAEDELRSVLTLRADHGKVSLLGTAGGTATTEQLEGDAQRLINLYRSRGYLDARVRVHASPARDTLGDAAVTAALLGADHGRRDLHVRFTIDEGTRTELTRIEVVFVDRHVATAEQVIDQAGLTPGSPFSADDLRSAEQRIRDWYYRIGRPRAVIHHRIEEESPYRLAVVFEVEELEEVRIGKVLVRGNFRTDRWVIIEELALSEGTVLTVERLSSARRRLRATGLFSAVDVQLLRLQDGRDDVVHALVRVEERDDVKIYADLEAGISSEKGAYVRIAPVVPNLFGNGISFQLGVVCGFNQLEVEWCPVFESQDLLTRIPRWVMRRYLRIGPDVSVSGYRRIQDTERFGELTTLSVSVAASRAWQRTPRSGVDARSIAATVRYDFRVRNRQEETVRVAGGNGATGSSTVSNVAGVVGVNVSWEQRVDRRGNLNPLSPVRGFKLEAGAGLASRVFFGRDDFVKVTGSGQWIRELSERLQLRVEGRYDQGFPLGGAVLLPEVERFFAGGDDTVRGFREDRLAVELIEYAVPPFGGLTQVRILPAGGNIRLLGSIDLQARLARVKSIPLASALFVDAGVITNTFAAFAPDDVRPSVGISLVRVLTPLGGISVDWALPMFPRSYDPQQGRLHIMVALRY